MKARIRTFCVVFVAWLGFGAAAAQADDAALAATLRKVVEEHAAAYDREDVAAAMGSIASQSPDYQSTQAALAEQFAGPDVEAKVVEFTYIGHDDEFAVARVKTKTVGTPKSQEFVDNTTDAIVLFHQDGGAWKLWSQHVLGVDLLP
jgi:hypothetical protein